MDWQALQKALGLNPQIELNEQNAVGVLTAVVKELQGKRTFSWQQLGESLGLDELAVDDELTDEQAVEVLRDAWLSRSLKLATLKETIKRLAREKDEAEQATLAASRVRLDPDIEDRKKRARGEIVAHRNKEVEERRARAYGRTFVT